MFENLRSNLRIDLAGIELFTYRHVVNTETHCTALLGNIFLVKILYSYFIFYFNTEYVIIYHLKAECFAMPG